MSSTASAGATASPTAPPKAPPQGGVLEGVNPVHFDANHPIILFIVQASIIIIFCRALHWPLSKIRQPRVISEIIGGILLGPSVLGRIPGFQASIFPAESMTNLNLVANLGLTLFLFIIGLEVDLRFLLSNWKVALNVGIVSMAIPFGLGCAIAVGLYNEFKDEPGMVQIEFPVFMLFIGVAMAITAFPVLCRILTELKLLMTPVGIIVLSAGVGNDVVGWILLALCVALVNAGSGLAALWVLLTCAGYMLFLSFLVRPAFYYILRRSRALQDGPSQGIIALTLLIALGSAFFTGIIGVHPIFGAFMAGLICPHEGGFAIKVAEKIEDLIGALFLPLYFTLSGLNTNIGLLDSGIVWAYVVGVVAVAFLSKFIGATIAARSTKMLWRECFAIGSLMSCKGLVELIVLNIGLNAKILSTRTFTIFVVMALVTTFASSPLTMYFYPPWYQKKVEAWRRGEIDWDTGKRIDGAESHDAVHFDKLAAEKVTRLTVYLRLDSMPNLLAFTSLFSGQASKPAPKIHPSKAASSADPSTPDDDESTLTPTRPVEANGLRLLNLTDRGSSVMQVSEISSYTAHDPIVNTFRTFGRLHNLAVSGESLVVPESSFSETLTARAATSSLLLLPWTETGGMSEQAIISDADTTSPRDKLTSSSSSYLAFVASTFALSPVPVAVLVNRNFGGSAQVPKTTQQHRLTRAYSAASLHSSAGVPAPAPPVADKSHHVFVPFFGGKDDRAALRLVLQIAETAHVTASIVRFEVPEAFFPAKAPSASSSSSDGVDTDADAAPSSSAITTTKPHTITTTTTRALSTNAEREADATFFATLSSSLPQALADRVLFSTVSIPSGDATNTTSPVNAVLERARAEIGQAPRNGGDLVVLGRNTGWSWGSGGNDGGGEGGGEDRVEGVLGGLAERVWGAGVRGSLVVVQGGR